MSMPSLRLAFFIGCLALSLPVLADSQKDLDSHGASTPPASKSRARPPSASGAEAQLPPRDEIVAFHLSTLLDARGSRLTPRLTEAQRAVFGKAIAGDAEELRDNALKQLFSALTREERATTRRVALESQQEQELVQHTNETRLSRISARAQGHSPSPDDERKIAELSESLAISRQLISLYRNVAAYLKPQR